MTGDEPMLPLIEQKVNDKGEPYDVYYMGLSIRQDLAARALQGLLSNSEHRKVYKGDSYLMQSEIYAQQAVKLADALIAELNKPKNKEQ